MNDIHTLHILLYSQQGNRQRDLIRINALDEKIQEVLKKKPLDQHLLRPSEDFELYQVSLRNSLVINLCQQEIKDVINTAAASTRKQIILSYLIACATVAIMSVCYVMKFHKVSIGLWLVTIVIVSKGVLDARGFDKYAYAKAINIEDRYFDRFFKTRQIDHVNDHCAICFDDFKGGIVKGHLAAGKAPHVFHPKCLDQMIEKVKQKASRFFVECPLCKDPIVPGSFEMRSSA